MTIDDIEKAIQDIVALIRRHIHDGIETQKLPLSSIIVGPSSSPSPSISASISPSSSLSRSISPSSSPSQSVSASISPSPSSAPSAMTLIASGTASNAASITISGLDLNSDEQYLVIVRYENGNSLSAATAEMTFRFNNDGGSNYSWTHQGYSNNGGGARHDAASSSDTKIEILPSISTDADGHIMMWINRLSSPTILVKFSLHERNPGAGVSMTMDGGGYYNAAANVTSFILDYPNAVGLTKTWTVKVYKISTT